MSVTTVAHLGDSQNCPPERNALGAYQQSTSGGLSYCCPWGHKEKGNFHLGQDRVTGIRVILPPETTLKRAQYPKEQCADAGRQAGGESGRMSRATKEGSPAVAAAAWREGAHGVTQEGAPGRRSRGWLDRDRFAVFSMEKPSSLGSACHREENVALGSARASP